MDVAKLYSAQCAACHGVDGTGAQIRASMPTIPDFTSLAWQMSQTDLEIAHRIVDGNEPLMPAFRDKLTREQNLALTIYVRVFAGETARRSARRGPSRQPGGARQPPSPAPSQMSAASLYGAYCLGCHEADGRGNARCARRRRTCPISRTPNGRRPTAMRSSRTTIRDGKGKFMLPHEGQAGRDRHRANGRLRPAFQRRQAGRRVEPRPPVRPAGQAAVVPCRPRSPRQGARRARRPKLAARLRVASALFRQYCLTCHGTDGKGTAMRASMPAIPDFTSRAWQEARENPQLSVSILDGKGPLMPAFRGRVQRRPAAPTWWPTSGPSVPPGPRGRRRSASGQ